ncbi:MAG TPA: hypothetical protein VG755_06825, partial [Nannocystaceae bacterium]|nr:hypothetical protein [Nannocystaceae bacterium]
MRILLVTPPMTQLNTPYPATAYLLGFLKQHAERLGLAVAQADPALALFLRLFSRDGLAKIVAAIDPAAQHPAVAQLRTHRERYLATVDPTIRFLQGKDPTLALRIVGRDFLPEGPRFAALASDSDDDDTLAWAFGALGLVDRAKHLASLYVDDLADAIKHGVDPHFELSRYGEKLGASAATFDALHGALAQPPTLVDDELAAITRALVDDHRPDLVGLTVPFPGNVYGAFRIARTIRAHTPKGCQNQPKIALGGGWVNTELRGLADPRVFDDVDFITLDDGERPLLALVEHLRDHSKPLRRTFIREHQTVVLRDDPQLHDIPLAHAGTPSWHGLPLHDYVSLVEMLNPMHRLWSDGRWNKLTIAHGCYWKQCSFCDVTLDYIARYDPVAADVLVDRIQAIANETGQTGFHF